MDKELQLAIYGNLYILIALARNSFQTISYEYDNQLLRLLHYMSSAKNDMYFICGMKIHQERRGGYVCKKEVDFCLYKGKNFFLQEKLCIKERKGRVWGMYKIW